jgi:hypothetical protein
MEKFIAELTKMLDELECVAAGIEESDDYIEACGGDPQSTAPARLRLDVLVAAVDRSALALRRGLEVYGK